jgi:hypothetical protein
MGEIESGSDLRQIAEKTQSHVRAYLSTVTQVASGAAPGAELALLLLATSDLVACGAHLAATTDVVPVERFEPDAGPDTDVDPLRVALAKMFDGFDDYMEVVDPVLSHEVGRATISGDLACIVEELAKGLAHYDEGHELEALWWWQFSFLSSWGERAAAAVRVLQAVLAHLRLDVDDDVAQEAEYDALHA